jgi:leader peptidase (prepilin peptidase)/N-methyltransferase
LFLDGTQRGEGMALIANVIIGALIGVLINYLADVLPITRKFSQPLCLDCGRLFTLREYLFSFKCPKCKRKTPARVIIVLILTIISSVLIEYFPLGNLSFWATLPLMLFLGVILVIDVEYRVVLKETSYIGLVLMFVYGIILHGFLPTLFGGLAGLLIMLGLYFLGVLFNRIMGRIKGQAIDEVALGFGDVYVTTFLGFLTGWPAIIAVLLLAILASGVFSLFYILVKAILRKYQAFSAIPYTPFLILAAVAILYIY